MAKEKSEKEVEIEYLMSGRYSVANEEKGLRDTQRIIPYIDFDEKNPIQSVPQRIADHLLQQRCTRTKQPYFRLVSGSRRSVTDEVEPLVQE